MNTADRRAATVARSPEIVSDGGAIAVAAKFYLSRGWVPVPEHRDETRAPMFKGWQRGLNLGPWPDGANVGVLLGAEPSHLAAVDNDCPEAVELFPYFMPETWVIGRASKPISQAIYRSVGAVTRQHRFGDGAKMLEVRGVSSEGTPTKSTFPPSVHYSGETIVWHPDFGDGLEAPREIDAVELDIAVRKLARACILRREGCSVEEAIVLVGQHVPRRQPPPEPTRRSSCAGDPVKRAKAYIAKMPEAVTGSFGHTALFRAAVALVKGFKLSDDLAFEILSSEYNHRCAPPWPEKELRRKIKQAHRARKFALLVDEVSK
jgi:hypothetical protein